MSLPPSLTQYLGDLTNHIYNGGEQWDNRTTTAMQTWLITKRLLKEADRLGLEMMQLIRRPK